jgi:long-chain acyl-CoA synthetase
VSENFVRAIEANARRYRQKPALLWEGGSLSWEELDRLASGFARELSEQGVRAGDRIALVMPNRPEFAVAFLGALKLGATPAPLNPLLKADEIAASLEDLRPRLLLREAVRRAGEWETDREAEAAALILYTSGSTGRPKGAVFSHSALAFANRSWAGPVMGLAPEDRVLVALPLAHSLGLNGGLLAPLLAGSTVVLVERSIPETVFDAIRRHRVTVLPAVATIFRRLLNSPAFAGADLSSLRLAVSGAAPCPWELALEWRERTGTRIVRGYGMTELFRPISYRPDDPTDLPDAVGKPVPGVEVRLEHDSDAAGGELFIKSPAVMEGYLDDPEETRAVLENGWFRTGDLASLTPEGYVRIVGRKRERILRGGYSIFPQEIEAVLLSHPAVAEAAVVGLPSPDLGEEVAAFVSLKPGARAKAEELLEYCKARLARYKYPRELKILSELPKGPTGKILKSELARGFEGPEPEPSNR